MPDRDWQTDLRQRQRQKRIAYQILGLSGSDSVEELKRAWRRLILQCHPDHNSGSTDSHQRFILVNSAYQCLTKEENCDQLDVVGLQSDELTDGKDFMENPRDYFAWWREMYFD